MTFISRFQEELKRNNLIAKSDRILVAFSGGKDSLCLLFLLHKFAKAFEIEVGACHVHHGIRGAEADEDLKFCKDFCNERNIPFYYEHVDAPAYSRENRLGMEESARILRYESLKRIANKEGYNKIATAHTASDQAETVLFRVIRGVGFDGMRGIPAQRDNVIRPLLPFYKEELLDFLKNNHLKFREDSTNQDTIYSRNRLRSNILPEMKRINPATEEALIRIKKIADEQHAFLSALCDEWEAKYKESPSSGRVSLKPLTDLLENQAMLPLIKEILFRMASKEKIVIDFLHYEALLELLKSPTVGKIIEIGKGFVFKTEDNFLVFCKNEQPQTHIEYHVKLSVGNNELPISQTVLKLTDKRRGKIENINKKLLIINAAFDKIEGNLFARNRKNGDTIQIGNMTKSIKKLFQEAKIPVRYRDQIPLICDAKGIVWVPYVGLCDRVRKSNTDEVITIELCTDYFPKTIENNNDERKYNV